MSIMDYLFNGGGSGRSKPSRSSGPKTRQKLQPRSTNAGLQSGDNTGIMSAAMTDFSPDFKGRWMTQSPIGNKFLSYLVNQFGSEGSSEYLEDILGTGGISAFGGTFSPNFERRDDGWNLGFTGKWNL